MSSARTIFLSLLAFLVTSLPAEDGVYVAVDSTGNPAARVIGEEAPATLDDSVVVVERAGRLWGKTKIVVNGVPFTRPEFEETFEFDVEIVPRPLPTKQATRVFDIYELKAALTALYGEEGDALIYACDRNLVWSLTHDAYWDTTDIIEPSGIHTFQVQDNVPVNEAAQEVFEEFISRVDPWNGVLNMPTWETEVLKDYLKRLNGLSDDADLDLALYEHWASTLPAKIEFIQKHSATVASIVITLPAMAGGAGADVVMSLGSLYNSVRDGQDATWDALSLVPYLRLPKGAREVAFRLIGIPGRAAIRLTADQITAFRSILSEVTEKTITAGEKLILKRLERVMDAGLADDVAELGCSGIFCFPAGTTILGANGPVAIEAIREGDVVLSWSESADSYTMSRVLQAFRAISPALVRFEIQGERIEVTPDHPVRVLTKGWVAARDVRPGDALETFEGSVIVEGCSELAVSAGIPVYNILVDGSHSYFASGLHVLFHNGGCWEEFLTKHHDGKVLSAITDPALAPRVIVGLFKATRRGYTNIQAMMLAKALRAFRPGNHEWIPVNRIYNSLFQKIINGAVAKKVLKFIDEARIDVNKLWFNKIVDPKTGAKGVSSANGRPYGHVGGRHADGRKFTKRDGVENAFHKACDDAFDKAVETGTFKIDVWEQEMQVKVLDKYFEGSQLAVIQAEFNAALAKWVP